jgi:hypothetical protein
MLPVTITYLEITTNDWTRRHDVRPTPTRSIIRARSTHEEAMLQDPRVLWPDIYRWPPK